MSAGSIGRAACTAAVIACLPGIGHGNGLPAPAEARNPPTSGIEPNDIALYGVVRSADSRQSIALLGTRGGPARPFRPGERIVASWQLLEVDGATAIVSDPAGSRFRLALVPEDGRGKSQAAARLPPIQRLRAPVPGEMPSDESLMQAKREFNLPASD